jgi:murein DD-endopeptidase
LNALQLKWGLVIAGLLSILFLGACGSPQSPCPAVTAPSASAALKPPPPSPAPPPVEGMWYGLLADRLHLALTVLRSEGGYRGVLDSLDQGTTLPIESVAVDQGAVRFEIASVGGKFSGKVDAATNELRGTWTQHDIDEPLTFTRTKGGSQASKREPAPKPLDAPVDVVVPDAPSVLRADGHAVLVYELHVTNLSRHDVSLRRVDVEGSLRPEQSVTFGLAHLEEADLALQVGRPGTDASGIDALKLGPGLRAVVFLWVVLDSDSTPASLGNRITVRVDDDPTDLTVSTAWVPVGKAAPIVISPPLRGRWWKAGNGPSKSSHHRRALISIGGKARISQRFAIDWVKLGDDGKTFQGDRLKNESYYAYGAEALAVEGGVVTETKDGIPQNVPGENRAVPVTLETVGGNHVIVDLGGGRFGFWAHLQPGSLKVKVGDHVKRGQVLGLVGNSGNSTQPHLHFHVSDGSSPLGSEGVPYAFDAFELQGKDDKAVTKRSKELPTEGEIVGFP